RGKGKGRGKGKQGREDSRVWSPCPLLPGVPTVPPPRTPQPYHRATGDVPSPTNGSPFCRDHTSSELLPVLSVQRLALEKAITVLRDIIEPGEDSEVDSDEILDISLKPRHIDEYPMDFDSIAELEVAEEVQELDDAADESIRNMVRLEADLLHFDWLGEPDNFEGVREVFTVPCTGPTFNNAELTPVEIFLKIWDADILAHIVLETNRYGAELMNLTMPLKPGSRLSRWKDVTVDEIRRFLAILMLQSLIINNVEREYWYPALEDLKIDNASLPVPSSKLDKIIAVIEHLNKKFSSLYLLEHNVAIDESLLLWKGRLSFAQKIATKKARAGIKSYELCESRTGYLWRMEVYSGKGHAHVAQVGEPEERGEELEKDEPESATVQIVLNLMRPILNKGYKLIMDNFYNAPLLYGYYRYKPQVVLDYNLSMGGIDHKDQMLSAYPIERARNIIWYKKLFHRLINVSTHNSFVMFNHNRTPALGDRAFRLQLAKQLLQISLPAAPSRPLTPAARPAPPVARPGVQGMHLPAKNDKKQRCKLC
ncbi:unnamed protein product, partial [Leptidea sinapis]